MSDISAWSNTAASNNSSPPAGAPEGMAPSTANDVMREMMAATRRWYEDAEWRDWGHTVTQASATTFTVPTDVTATYTVNRPIRCTDATTLYGYVSASSYSSPNTTVTVVLDSGSLSASLTAVALGISPSTYSVPVQALRPGTGGQFLNATPAWAYPPVVQVVEATPITTTTSTTSVIPFDDTIPQNTEGTELITVSITPKATANRLRIEFDAPLLAVSGSTHTLFALFQDSTADALAGVSIVQDTADFFFLGRLVHEMAAGTTSATTFKIRYGNAGGPTTTYINSNSTGRKLGGVAAVRLRVTEIAV